MASTALLATLGHAIQLNWRVGYDKSVHTCLPHRLYLIRLGPPTATYDDLIAFRVVGLEPHFADGSMFTKKVIGLPGDVVVVTPSGAQVGKRFLPFQRGTFDKLGLKAPSGSSRYRLKTGEYFMAGTNPRAFDSRYYGPVKATQFAGSSKPLW